MAYFEDKGNLGPQEFVLDNLNLMRSQLIAWDNLSWNLCFPNFVLDNYLWLKIIDKNINIEIKFKRENNLFIVDFRRTVVTKAPLRVQFLPTFGGGRGKSKKLRFY